MGGFCRRQRELFGVHGAILARPGEPTCANGHCAAKKWKTEQESGQRAATCATYPANDGPNSFVDSCRKHGHLSQFAKEKSPMPSFDVVSEVDLHELSNAIDQANREVSTRFDFKGSGANFELNEQLITLNAQVDFQLQQMLDILYNKLAKRKIDTACLEVGEATIMAKTATQPVSVQQGIETPLAKQMVKKIKESKLKVQTAIQGDQLRVTGKKRDDLQAVMALLREAELGLPLQFKNFRD
jgi:uncharacterized protein YajQ (UPF0234 family)